jgi:hypothetical protein
MSTFNNRVLIGIAASAILAVASPLALIAVAPSAYADDGASGDGGDSADTGHDSGKSDSKGDSKGDAKGESKGEAKGESKGEGKGHSAGHSSGHGAAGHR